MSGSIESLIGREYEHGFVTDIEADTFPPGLDEGVVRAISAKKGEPEFMLDWRLKAYRRWLTMKEPHWPTSTMARSTIRRRATTRRHATRSRSAAWTTSIPSC